MKLQLFSTGKELPPQAHPLFADLASCGFPSPAADYVESVRRSRLNNCSAEKSERNLMFRHQ
jgi:DNA polymerase V